MFKLQNSLASIPIPDYVGRQNTPQTRQYHPNKFTIPGQNYGTQINVYKFSYFPRTILDWNSLPTALLDNVDTEDIKSFKAALVDLRK